MGIMSGVTRDLCEISGIDLDSKVKDLTEKEIYRMGYNDAIKNIINGIESLII